MSFLFPFYLLGAAALALPLYLHLKRRPPKDAVAFSSLMFLRPTRAVHVKRRSQFENILLLILRSLALVGLALMFARPFLRDDAEAAQDDEAATRHVVLIDTSASMRRPGVWEAALDEAIEALPRSATASAAMIAFDRAPRPLVGFQDWQSWTPGLRRERARAALESVAPGWSGTDMGAAIGAGLDAIDEAEAAESGGTRIARHRISMVSDFQKSAAVDFLRDIEWPENADFSPRMVEAAEPGNAGLQWIKAATGAVPDVRITNGADSDRGRFTLKWADQSESEAMTVDVPAGESLVIKSPERARDDQGGAAILDLRGDAGDFDNRLWFAPAGNRTVRVLYTGPHDADAARSPFYYVRRGFPETGEMKPIFLEAGETGADFVIVPALSELDARAVAGVREALDQGLTALAVIDAADAAGNLRDLVGGAGVEVSEAPDRDYAILARIAFDHPALAAFDDPKVRDFTKIRFWKYRRVDAGSLPEGAVVLASFDSGDPAWIQIPVGRGTLVLLTSGWTPADSQLARSSKFVPLVYSLCGAGGLAAGAAVPTFAGDPLPPIENPGREAVVLTLPDGSVTTHAPDARPVAGTPGIYTLTVGAKSERFAVNVPPAESETAALPVSEFEALGIAVVHAGARIPAATGAEAETIQSRARDAERERQQRLWQWVVLCVILLLVFETWLAGRPARSTDSPDMRNPEPIPTS